MSLPSQKVWLFEVSDFVFHFSNYEIHETAAYSGRNGRESGGGRAAERQDYKCFPTGARETGGYVNRR